MIETQVSDWNIEIVEPCWLHYAENVIIMILFITEWFQEMVPYKVSEDIESEAFHLITWHTQQNEEFVKALSKRATGINVIEGECDNLAPHSNATWN